MTIVKKTREYYGYRMIQNPSNKKLSLYVCGVDAKFLRHFVSVDNAVKWDGASSIWRSNGRNRTIEEAHWKSIQEFLSSTNLEKILPSAIVISVEAGAFEFTEFTGQKEIANVLPGMIRLTGNYESDPEGGDPKPCTEVDRPAWVLDGQHRIKAFREWSMPDPYPVNTIILKAWRGADYEDVMRHQTYELNMGRPLSDDFKAAVREQYKEQLGHKEYKRQIALSWIRKDIEGRGRAFAPTQICGASNLRTPFVVSMSFVEKLIQLGFDNDTWLDNNYTLEKMTPTEVKEVGKYLFDFFEGVRLSMGVLNPNTKGTIGTEPEVNAAVDYWDIATETKHKQRLLHNVGLKGVVRGLLNKVMRSDTAPTSPAEVAASLDHMRGIPWHDPNLQSKKDDWVGPLAGGLAKMFDSKGTDRKGKKYQMTLQKKDKSGNVVDTFSINCHGW